MIDVIKEIDDVLLQLTIPLSTQLNQIKNRYDTKKINRYDVKIEIDDVFKAFLSNNNYTDGIVEVETANVSKIRVKIILEYLFIGVMHFRINKDILDNEIKTKRPL